MTKERTSPRKEAFALISASPIPLTEVRRHFSAKTVRERLLSYLSAQARRSQTSSVQIPFDRRGLADYLNLDRTAVSKEIGKMRREGLIDFSRKPIHVTLSAQVNNL